MKFIDLARQMEAFFIQKRFLLSSLKPELVLKEENVDLRVELTRKEELIKRHYEKIEHWKSMLSEHQQQHQSVQPQVPPGGPPGPSGEMRGMPMGGMGGMNMPPQIPQGPMGGPMGGVPNAMQV